MNSGNPILDKNLECISRYNPELSEAILNITSLTNEFELVETDLQEPNYKYNGIYIHSQAGAENEARIGFDSVKNTPTSRHIVLGLGIGHLFKECCERSKGMVFLYEPDLEMLRVTLEIVDFSKELGQTNVFVANDMNFLKLAIKQTYIYGCSPYFLALPSYRNNLYADKLNKILEDLRTVFVSLSDAFNLSSSKEEESIHMLIKNMPQLIETTPLYELQNIYKGKTALIIGAGPTLDLNIETIKKNRDKVVIFCVGTAFRTLITNGITPDFVNIIEIVDASSQLKGLDVSNINLITETYTNHSIFQFNVKRRFIFPSSLNYANNFWARTAEFDISPYLVKGTVSYAALASAKMLGCAKMILVGQDLAYVNNQCYTKDAVYSDLVYEIDEKTKHVKFNIKDENRYYEGHSPAFEETEEVAYTHGKKGAQNRLKTSDATLCQTKGIAGDMVYTSVAYLIFKEDFEEFAYTNKNLNLINSSMHGAQLDGFENIPLEDALKDAPLVENIEFKPFSHSPQNVLENLEKVCKQLNDFLKIFSKAKECLRKYEREMSRSKTFTPQSIKYIKETLNFYDELVVENSEGYENFLYLSLSYTEEAQMKYIMTEYEEYTFEEIESTYKCLKEYFTNIEGRINVAIDLIQKRSDVIREKFNIKM